MKSIFKSSTFSALKKNKDAKKHWARRVFEKVLDKKENLLAILGIFTFFALWQAISIMDLVDRIFISSPLEVISELALMFANGNIYPHLIISLEEFFLGFLLAVLLGITLGIFIGWYKYLHSFSNSLIYSFYSTPMVALIPLIIIWLGLGVGAKVVIVFLASFFPILINTIGAVRNLDPVYTKLGKSFGANDFDIFRFIAFPASIPFISTGIRVAIPRGIIGMIVGEFFVSNKGIGYLITFYGSTFQTGKLLAVVVLIVSVSTILTYIANFFEKLFAVNRKVTRFRNPYKIKKN